MSFMKREQVYKSINFVGIKWKFCRNKGGILDYYRKTMI